MTATGTAKKKAQSMGAAFEAKVAEALAAYQGIGHGIYWRHYLPSRFAYDRRARGVVLRPTGDPAMPDFGGVHRSAPVLMEAKTGARSYLSLGKDRYGMTPDEMKFLEEFAMHGRSFILFENRADCEVWRFEVGTAARPESKWWDGGAFTMTLVSRMFFREHATLIDGDPLDALRGIGEGFR